MRMADEWNTWSLERLGIAELILPPPSTIASQFNLFAVSRRSSKAPRNWQIPKVSVKNISFELKHASSPSLLIHPLPLLISLHQLFPLSQFAQPPIPQVDADSTQLLLQYFARLDTH
jgi:hypothetical protein